MNTQKIDGLVAATYTPLDDDGAVDAKMVGLMAEHLLGSGITNPSGNQMGRHGHEKAF